MKIKKELFKDVEKKIAKALEQKPSDAVIICSKKNGELEFIPIVKTNKKILDWKKFLQDLGYNPIFLIEPKKIGYRLTII